MAGWEQRWPAPAKINLMLRITGRRTDGYHLLQTVFQLTDLSDWLTFSPIDTDQVLLETPLTGVPVDIDLSVRAAYLLKQETGCQKGVRITIEKNIPMGGGLGGGSSDAATTLVVLNHLWKLGLSNQQLRQMGLKLGADVPIFVYGYAAWAEGIGEELQKITLPENWLVIIKPNCHVDTREIFSTKGLTRDSKSITIADFVAGQHRNDCFDVVSKLYQPVRDAIKVLNEFSEARLTGTGACVFAEFESEDLARSAYNVLRLGWDTYLSKGMNRSLLLDKLV